MSAPPPTAQTSQAAAQETSTPNPKKRQRSNGGCTRCKKRKIKCDEKRPSCSRCLKGGVQCPGYPTNVLKWRTKHEIHRIATPSDSSSRRAGQDLPGSTVRQQVLPPLSLVATQSSAPAPQVPALLAHPSNKYGDYGFNMAVDADDPQPTSRRVSESSNLSLDDLSYHDAGCPEDFLGPGETATFLDGEQANSLDDLEETDQVEELDYSNTSMNLPVVPYASHQWDMGGLAPVSTISSSLLHIPTVLVEYYFQKVCRECSTFDSSHNPFRSVVSNMLSSSASVNHAITSLAASKLADDMPSMRAAGIEAQGNALAQIKRELTRVDSLDKVSEGVLMAIFLLGMTTSWHVREDIGLEYLLLARGIVKAKADSNNKDVKANLAFFQDAIKYWTMIVSMVSAAADTAHIGDFESTLQIAPLPRNQNNKMMPHPWTGISPISQQLFGQVLQLTRNTRDSSGKQRRLGYSRASITEISNTLATAIRLESECWSVRIPSVEDLEDTGDPVTPRMHHVLTARGYLLSALLHIYMIFPDVLSARIEHIVSEAPTAGTTSTNTYTTFTCSKASLWPDRGAEDDPTMWLRDVGLRIAECIESIDVSSSTRVVHPPLLLSVSTSLTLPARYQQLGKGKNQWERSTSGISDPQEKADEELHFRIRHYRSFIISRLETMHAAMRFHAIDNILKVIKEVWRRADAGGVDIHWMDVMHEMGCATLFG